MAEPSSEAPDAQWRALLLAAEMAQAPEASVAQLPVLECVVEEVRDRNKEKEKEDLEMVNKYHAWARAGVAASSGVLLRHYVLPTTDAATHRSIQQAVLYVDKCARAMKRSLARAHPGVVAAIATHTNEPVAMLTALAQGLACLMDDRFSNNPLAAERATGIVAILQSIGTDAPLERYSVTEAISFLKCAADAMAMGRLSETHHRMTVACIHVLAMWSPMWVKTDNPLYSLWLVKARRWYVDAHRIGNTFIVARRLAGSKRPNPDDDDSNSDETSRKQVCERDLRASCKQA